MREAEIIELVKCDSIVSAWASTLTVGDGVWKETAHQSKYFSSIQPCWFVSQMPFYVLGLPVRRAI